MNKEIRVVAKLEVQREHINQVIEVFKKLVNETRKEFGCLQYDLHQEVHDPATLIFFEKWRTMDDLNKHLKTAHFIACFKEVGSMVKHNETRILEKI